MLTQKYTETSGQGQYKTHHTINRYFTDLFMDLPEGNKEHDKGVHYIGRTTFVAVELPTFLQAGFGGGTEGTSASFPKTFLGSWAHAGPCLSQPPQSAPVPLLGHWGLIHLNPGPVGHPMLASPGLPGGNGGLAIQPPMQTLCLLGPGL